MRAAVYGIGNILLGDDGVGPAVAHYLDDNYAFSDEVLIEDLGTPSLDLPNYISGHDVVIFVDAVKCDAPAGAIRTYSRDEITSVPTGIRISPHEPTINDALIVLDFAGNAPRDVVLVGVVPQTLDGGIALTQPVAAAVEEAAEVVLAELAVRGIHVHPRTTTCAWRAAVAV
jgi:hydrogenase maturation protease